NPRIAGVEIPIGLLLILGVLLVAALANLLTKEVATLGGILFTCIFFTAFWLSERYYHPRRQEHLEQFNEQMTEEVTADGLGLNKRYRKLVAIRSPHNLFMLDRALAETDPETTGVVVLTAKLLPPGAAQPEKLQLDVYEQELLSEVVRRAERVGKEVK